MKGTKADPNKFFEPGRNSFVEIRSTTDATFILDQIVEKAIEFDKVAFTCFVDPTRALDSRDLNSQMRPRPAKESEISTIAS